MDTPKFFCQAYFNVLSNGDVTPCNQLHDILIANVYKESLREIFKKNRDRLLCNFEIKGYCNGKCENSDFCYGCRALDNVFVERLWRSVKYEEVYLNDYQDVRAAKEGLGRYFRFYNTERLHQSLGYATPTEVYYKDRFDLRQRQAA